MYSANMPEMYYEILKMYCNQASAKQAEIEECYTKGDWENYTVHVHALKSGSLTIGGKKLSEAAKALEMAGKDIRAGKDVEKAKEYITAHHADTMQLYERTAAAGRKYLAQKGQ